MNNKRPSWIEQECARSVEIERETIEVLGEEKAGFFITAANDCATVSVAAYKAYPVDQGFDIMLLMLWGLFKEACRCHTFFVTGNYPWLISRLRFIWESIFRAYFVKHYPMGPCRKWDLPGSTTEEQMMWLDKHGDKLNVDRCIEPVLLAVFPQAAGNQSILDDCKALFKYLHRYAHLSAYLLDRQMDHPALLLTDDLDEHWARETLEIGAKVFALVWMAVFAHYPDAFELVEPLEGKYPVVSEVFEREKAEM